LSHQKIPFNITNGQQQQQQQQQQKQKQKQKQVSSGHISHIYIYSTKTVAQSKHPFFEQKKTLSSISGIFLPIKNCLNDSLKCSKKGTVHLSASSTTSSHLEAHVDF